MVHDLAVGKQMKIASMAVVALKEVAAPKAVAEVLPATEVGHSPGSEDRAQGRHPAFRCRRKASRRRCHVALVEAMALRSSPLLAFAETGHFHQDQTSFF